MSFCIAEFQYQKFRLVHTVFVPRGVGAGGPEMEA